MDETLTGHVFIALQDISVLQTTKAVDSLKLVIKTVLSSCHARSSL